MEYLTNLYLMFVDFEKAFDSINRNKVWEVMNRYGMLWHIINLIKKLYDGSTCQVLHEGKLSDTIGVNTGVRQGCILSPIIYLIVMDNVMNKVMLAKKRGINWGVSQQLEDLLFADDICLLSHNFNKMHMKLKDLEKIGKTVGLKINCERTKPLRINVECNKKFQIRGENVEEVDKFTYIGTEITRDLGTEIDVKTHPESKFSLYTVV
jgi:hypothetical protein